jgi:hypothetical protein
VCIVIAADLEVVKLEMTMMQNYIKANAINPATNPGKMR